jgi:hypothetical protein
MIISTFDSSVGRAVDCRGLSQVADIHRSLVQIRLEGIFFLYNLYFTDIVHCMSYSIVKQKLISKQFQRLYFR